MNGKVTVVAIMRAKPGMEEQVRQALLGLCGPTRAEKGCINYDLYQSIADPALFIFHENWESVADLDAHGQSAHLQAWRRRAADLLAEPAQVMRRRVRPEFSAVRLQARLATADLGVAGEKAGVLRPGRTTVHGPLPAEARAAIEERAAAIGARLVDAAAGGFIADPFGVAGAGGDLSESVAHDAYSGCLGAL